MLGKNVFLGLCALAFGGAIVVQPFGGEGQSGKIGFVDLKRVREQSKSQLALVDQLEKKFKAEAERLRAVEEKLLKRRREDLPVYVKGTPEWNKLFIELRVESERLKAEKQLMRAQIEDDKVKMVESLFAQVSEKAKVFADANGYDAIFMKRALPKVGAGPEGQFDLVDLQNQWVLYNSDATDVTDEVAKLLNQP